MVPTLENGCRRAIPQCSDNFAGLPYLCGEGGQRGRRRRGWGDFGKSLPTTYGQVNLSGIKGIGINMELSVQKMPDLFHEILPFRCILLHLLADSKAVEL